MIAAAGWLVVWQEAYPSLLLKRFPEVHFLEDLLSNSQTIGAF